MRCGKGYYPVLRRNFKNCDEIGEKINRKNSYVKARLAGRADFTVNEKMMLLDALCLARTAENLNEVFAK